MPLALMAALAAMGWLAVGDSSAASVPLAGSRHRWSELLAPSPRAIPAGQPSAAAYARLALGAYADGDFGLAAQWFAAAARWAAGPRQGVLEARAGEAFERAGLFRAAVEHYRVALRRLPEAAGWIAVRLARLAPDTAQGFEWLRRAPQPARGLALEVRARLLMRAGAARRAVGELVRAGQPGRAAALAAEAQDLLTARRLAWDALAGADTGQATVALNLLASGTVPLDGPQGLRVAQELERRGRFAEAAAWRERSVRQGDRSAGALLAWGAALEAAGQRRTALEVFAAARRAPGTPDETLAAEYAYARALLLSGQTLRGTRLLLAFARREPAHPAQPRAVLAVAEARWRAGALRLADSAYQALVRHWPQTPWATEARVWLAMRALDRRQPGRARSLLADAVRAGGPSALAARYLLGRLASANGDSARAREQWGELIREDPIGYYGVLARQALGGRAASFDSAPPALRPVASQAVREELRTLVLLDALGFAPEADALACRWLQRSDWTAGETLALAQGLLARGRPALAVSLGWRLARLQSLGDPEVLRLIFPLPWRALIEAEAGEFRLDPFLLAAVIRQESGFRPRVVSRAGALGLMQLMPATAALTASRLGVPWQERWLGVPEVNVHLGAAHLALLLQRYRGAAAAALAAYNAGGRPVERWLKHPQARDAFRWVEVIPYPETKGYVRSVLRNWALYRALYGAGASP